MAQVTVVFVLCFLTGSLSSKETVRVRKQGGEFWKYSYLITEELRVENFSCLNASGPGTVSRLLPTTRPGIAPMAVHVGICGEFC